MMPFGENDAERLEILAWRDVRRTFHQKLHFISLDDPCVNLNKMSNFPVFQNIFHETLYFLLQMHTQLAIWPVSKKINMILSHTR